MSDEIGTRLAACEAVIDRQNFLEEAEAFQTICKDRLYLYEDSPYQNFDQYCRGRWKRSSRSVQYLIRCLEVGASLRTLVRRNCPDFPLPRNEQQCRPLQGLDPEFQAEEDEEDDE